MLRRLHQPVIAVNGPRHGGRARAHRLQTLGGLGSAYFRVSQVNNTDRQRIGG